jgi:hypothetical protein
MFSLIQSRAQEAIKIQKYSSLHSADEKEEGRRG